MQFTSGLEVFLKTFSLQAKLAVFSVLRNQSSHLTSTKESISVVMNVCITYCMHRSFIYHASQNSYIMHNKGVLSSFAFPKVLLQLNSYLAIKIQLTWYLPKQMFVSLYLFSSNTISSLF